MLLLLDAHIPLAVARALRQDGVDAVALRDWKAGSYREAPDEPLLLVALADARTLVTYDRRTIPRLLKEWAETGRHHAGVVFVDERTVRPDAVGVLARALLALAARSGSEDWGDRVVFLQRG